MWSTITKHAATAFGATAATLAVGQAIKVGRRATAGRDANYMVRAAAEQMREDADAILNNLPRDRRLMPWAENYVASGADRLHSVAQALRFSPSRGLVPEGNSARFGVRNALVQSPAGLPTGRRAPTTSQRRSMGSSKMALPWSKASARYRRAHPELSGVGGYPMDTIKRARAARGYAVQQLNAGNLTQADVKTIFARTARKWGLDPLDGLSCTKRSGKRRCRSIT
jgi:hypothetical protein